MLPDKYIRQVRCGGCVVVTQPLDFQPWKRNIRYFITRVRDNERQIG